MEDIINRGGGNLVMELYMGNEKGDLIEQDVRVSIDGVLKTFKAGDRVIIGPGESITLKPYRLSQVLW